MTYNVFSGTLNPTHFTSLHYSTENYDMRSCTGDGNVDDKRIENCDIRN